MVDIGVMIEGQDGTNWTRWRNLAATVEASGFAGLYRSDHFTNGGGPIKDALEMWTSLTWLASHSSRIEFGPLVSPVSFRDPVVTAWTAAALDELSGGRFRLGLGAGWQEREHQMLGYDLLDVKPRFQRFAEALDIITRLLRGAEPFTYQGEYYRLDNATMLPKPTSPNGPPIVIGGNGARRTLPLVARYADEWNAVSASPAVFADLNAQLDTMLRAENRDPAAVRRSLMVSVFFGRSAAELEQALGGRSIDEVRARGAVIGDARQIIDHVQALGAAGVQTLMLRWWDQDDMAGLARLADAVLPYVG